MEQTINQLLGSNDFLNFLFSELSSAIFLVDENLKVQNINHAFSSVFNKEEEEAVGELCGNAINCINALQSQCGESPHCGSCQLRKNCISSLSENSEPISDMFSREFVIDGQKVMKHLRYTLKRVQFHGRKLIVVAIDDITEIEEQKRKLKDMAEHDFLTNLPNRRSFFEVGQKLLNNARRGNLPIVTAMLDIDHFKNINDTYGHDAGDTALKDSSQIISKTLRDSDLIGRLGGEEFGIILTNSSKECALQVLELIRVEIEKHQFIHQNLKFKLTVSIGATSILEDSLDDMLKKADTLLYKAKESGRNRIIS